MQLKTPFYHIFPILTGFDIPLSISRGWEIREKDA